MPTIGKKQLKMQLLICSSVYDDVKILKFLEYFFIKDKDLGKI